ncbi:type IV secretory system conjugative DNA transfer family protein [Nocardia wallacei]|uniref:type IV secretory system conjugative DNA transfer family protein n=1 Tax=Nocardia wallacei TaxID=480035 RepID=UPI002458727E|nr:TraM recognition domain-containing protein [Nocardia wallacei]
MISAPATISAPDPHHSPLGTLLLDPGRLWREITTTGGLPGSGPALTTLVVAGAIVLAAGVLARARWHRPARGIAREVTVLVPPTVDAKGARGLWAHLTGLLGPAWKRALFGQPHVTFEYGVTPEAGAVIRIWVPGCVPPGLVERAVTSAWPGARTRTTSPAGPPLPSLAAGMRRVVAGGELRLGRRDSLPIQADPLGGDPVRDLLAAAEDLDTGQATCVQILARPVTGRQARRTTAHPRPPGVLRLLGSVAAELLDLVTPGPARRSHRPGLHAPFAPGDRQAALEYSAAARAEAAKARGAHWETRVRYAASVDVAVGADPDALRVARAVARGRAHALATVFGAFSDHNYYRRKRRPLIAHALGQRRLGRGDLLSIPELAAIARLPLDSDLPGLDRAGARALAPAAVIPTGGEHTKPLGVSDSGGGRPVAVRVADGRHHFHVLGPTGTGKSNLLAQWILDDADADRGVVVVDPKGDLVADILARLPRSAADRIVLFDSYSRANPPCVNPLDTDPATADLAVDNLVTIFRRIYSQHWGPRTDDLLRSALFTLCTQPGTATLADVPRLLTEPAYRARLTSGVTDPEARGFWTWYEALSDAGRSEVNGPLLNKLRPLLMGRPFVRNAIAAGRSTVDLADVLDHGGICLARLAKGALGEETVRLIGSLLVARTWHTAAARARTPSEQRADASLILDEAHNFLNLSTPVEDMLAEARGLRLSLVLAHQNLGQLPKELRDGISANARNKLIFSASPEDAKDLARHTQPWLGEHDLTHLDAFHAAARLLVNGQQAPPFTVTTRKLPPAIPGRARELRAAARARLNPPTTEAPGPGTPPQPREPRPPARDPRR